MKVNYKALAAFFAVYSVAVTALCFTRSGQPEVKEAVRPAQQQPAATQEGKVGGIDTAETPTTPELQEENKRLRKQIHDAKMEFEMIQAVSRKDVQWLARYYPEEHGKGQEHRQKSKFKPEDIKKPGKTFTPGFK